MNTTNTTASHCIELAQGSLRPNVAPEVMSAVQRSIEAWLATQQGFVRRTLCNLGGDRVMDIVEWRTREDAMRAMGELSQGPLMAEMATVFALDTFSIQHADVIVS
ncbi:MAG: hypothetical protein JNK05_33210 [Myxococcales bacterium]|nr:hypothetical protein [Myxococcales bacterium]